VLATGPRDLAVRFDGVTDKSRQPLSKYIASGWVTGLDESSIRETRIGGLPAATARATADKWDFDITVIPAQGSDLSLPDSRTHRQWFAQASAGCPPWR
jgi:predicted Zn-dependent protease